jgi:hypothetical protein
MGYIGSQPATNFETVRKQVSTTNSGTTITLDYSVSSVQDILVTVNAVVQSYDNYSVSGTTLTLGGTLNNDRVEILYVGRTFQTVSPATGTVNLDMLSATGTKDATTFLRGDNTFATAGADADNYFATSGLSSKDLGVGLHIKTADSSGSVDGNADELVVEGSGQSGITILSGASDKGNIFFADSGSTAQGKIIYDHSSDFLRFDTAGSERFRINSGGSVLIGRTTNSVNNSLLQVKSQCIETDADTTGIQFNRTDSNAAWVAARFKVQNSLKGFIQVNTSSTTYSTSSDYRLKENEVAISDGITRLKNLKPYRFNFIADNDADGKPTETVDGFFAHEVSSVVPEAVTGTKDAMAVETRYTADDVETQGDNPSKKVGDAKTYSTTEIDPQGIDQSKLVPLLTSALQEAITKIETLEARVQALENA